LRAFTEALRLELVQKDNTKIRVSNVSPGAVKTEMAFSSMKDQSPEIIEKIYESISFLLPEEVAQTVSFLLEVPYSVNITELTVKPTGEKM
jgi:NADP+-dependent farnesol dehydrogenase